MIIDILSWLFIGTGVFLGLTSALGLLRLPDLYTRVHAAGISDTYYTALILLGLALNSGFSLISVKLIFIILLLWFTSTISTHVLLKAAHQSKLLPKLQDEEDQNRISDH